MLPDGRELGLAAGSVNGVAGLTAMVYVFGPALSLASSFTETVRATVCVRVGVPPIDSVVPPLLETVMPSAMVRGVPLVWTAVGVLPTVTVKQCPGPLPPEALIDEP